MINLSAAPVKGVVVEYHVYNKTTVSGSGNPTVTLDDITGTSTVDLAGNEKKQIETSDIPHNVTNTSTATTGGGKKGGPSSTSSSSSVQSVYGWVVYLKFNGKIVHTFKDPDNVMDYVNQYNKKNGGYGG